MLDNFFTKGYVLFHEPNLIDLNCFEIVNVEIYDKLPLNAFDENEQKQFMEFSKVVTEKYVTQLFGDYYEILGYGIWDGVDPGSMNWHNDQDEGLDFNVLYYHDTMLPETGGQIEFKYPGGQDCVYPKSGDLIIINQDFKFMHKASRSTISRRVASIEFKKL